MRTRGGAAGLWGGDVRKLAGEEGCKVDDDRLDARRAPAGDGVGGAAGAVTGSAVPGGQGGELGAHLERADAGQAERELVRVFVGDADAVDVPLRRDDQARPL